MTEALYVQDLRGRILRTGPDFEALTGYSAVDNILDVLAPRHRDLARDHMIAIAGGEPPRPLRVDLITRTGAAVPIEIRPELVLEEGKPVAMQCFATADHTQAAARVEALSRYFAVLHGLSNTSYNGLDDLFANYLAAGSEIFGLPDGMIVQCNGATPCVRMTRGQGPHDIHALPAQRISADITVGEQSFGAIHFYSHSGVPKLAADPNAKHILELMAQGVGSAIFQHQLVERLAHQARHDALTELPNRLLLAERLSIALEEARRNNSAVAVVFIDLDMFKQINDTLGHAVGDAVLQQIARRLENCMREGDTLARMGGDEFTAILTSTQTSEESIAYARRLLSAVRKPCRVQEYELFVTASIGMAFCPDDGEDAATLLRNADAAMYSAKYRGKNDVHFYKAEVTATALKRLELETQLRHALNRQELRMMYQPQVDISGQLAGMEVLLAWEHPELGRISPAQFIPIAEETGMILPIGGWVLRNACRVAAKWHRMFRTDIPVAVNVSALQFAQANFVQNIADALSASGLNARSLELELTESLVMRDVEQSAAIMRELRELGVRIAIDDFGTGYSSLSYLPRIPADALKIDQSFLHDIAKDSARAIFHAIAVLGHTFGLQVTAEGVETADQFELVRAAGCDRVQGHLFGEALTAARMEDRLAKAARPQRAADPHLNER